MRRDPKLNTAQPRIVERSHCRPVNLDHFRSHEVRYLLRSQFPFELRKFQIHRLEPCFSSAAIEGVLRGRVRHQTQLLKHAEGLFSILRTLRFDQVPHESDDYHGIYLISADGSARRPPQAPLFSQSNVGLSHPRVLDELRVDVE